MPKKSISDTLHTTALRSVKLGHNKTHETHMHAWQESQKQGGEIGISGSRVDGIRSLPPARTHQKLEVISLSGLSSYKKQNRRKGVDWMLSERKKKENLEELTSWNRSESCFPQVQMNHWKKKRVRKSVSSGPNASRRWALATKIYTTTTLND